VVLRPVTERYSMRALPTGGAFNEPGARTMSASIGGSVTVMALR